jgi:hypothetical protein
MSTLSANVGADGVESGKEVARMSTLSVNVGADGGHKKQLAELSKQLKLPQDREWWMELLIQQSDTSRGTAVDDGAPAVPAVDTDSDTHLYVLKNLLLVPSILQSVLFDKDQFDRRHPWPFTGSAYIIE